MGEGGWGLVYLGGERWKRPGLSVPHYPGWLLLKSGCGVNRDRHSPNFNRWGFQTQQLVTNAVMGDRHHLLTFAIAVWAR